MNPQCEECIAIARELHDASAEALRDKSVRKFYSGFGRMLQGQSDAVAAAEEALPELRAADIWRLQPSPAARALYRAPAQQSPSGHKIPFRQIILAAARADGDTQI
jgi:hypothetical protein